MKKYFASIALLLILNSLHAQLSPAALHFNGTSDFVRIPINSNYNFFNEVTVEAWVKVETTNPPSQYGPILCNVDALSGVFLSVISGGVFFTCGNNGVQTGFNFNDGNCHHVAATASNGGVLSLYVDGVLKATDLFQGPVGNPGDLFIGKTSPNISIDYFNGLIKEVRLWNGARTQTDIQNNMNVVLNAAANPGLIGYWRCSETSGQTITDFSTVANNATMGNSTAVENEDPSFANGCPSCTSPSATITAGGPTVFCSGSSVVLNAPVANNRSYQWIKAGVNIAGATASAYTASNGGNYKLNVTNTVTGCAKTTNTSTTVTVNSLPSAIITPQGPTTFCAGGQVTLQANTGSALTYKWKKNMNFISGATSSSYSATTAGNYKTVVTNAHGCSKVSSPLTVTVPCREIETVTPEKGISIYSDPAIGYFNIYFSGFTENFEVIITDIMGRTVYSTFSPPISEMKINTGNFSKGIYTVTIKSAYFVESKKIVVQ